MQKVVASIALLAVLAMPVRAQSLDFLANLMKAVVQEFGIENVISVLEDLGYVGEGEVVAREATTPSVALTVNHDIWDLPEDETVDALLPQMDDPGNEDCWTYVELGTSEYVSAADRMKYRAKFIDDCVSQ